MNSWEELGNGNVQQVTDNEKQQPEQRKNKRKVILLEKKEKNKHQNVI